MKNTIESEFSQITKIAPYMALLNEFTKLEFEWNLVIAIGLIIGLVHNRFKKEDICQEKIIKSIIIFQTQSIIFCNITTPYLFYLFDFRWS